MQLFSSNFFAEQQHLNFLDLSECDLEISEMLPHFCRHETSIASLVLGGNRLAAADGLAPITDFQRISSLNLSCVSCSGPILLALFTALSNASRARDRLILDSLDFANSTVFYENIARFELRSLELFSFCRNELTNAQFMNLIAFIRKQPRLFALGLSGTVRTAEAVAELASLFGSTEIHALELRAGDNPLGPLLIPLLDALLRHPTIIRLDVTGQAVGDAGIERLAALAEASLEDLRCDGCAPSSQDVLLGAISRFASSKLVSCTWLYKDLSALSGGIPPNQWKPVMEQFDLFRKPFEKRLGPGDREDILARAARRADLSIGSSSWGAGTQPAAERQMLSYRDGFVRSGLFRVFDVGHWSEPLVVALEAREAADSLEALVREAATNAPVR
jgi:hypothetical protein